MEHILYLIVAFVVIDLIIIGFVYYKRKHSGLSKQDKKKFLHYWKLILEDDNDSSAVLKADKLLDKLLGKKGYNGSLGQKLKSARSLFSDIDGVWSAHKLRNRIAHDIDVQVSKKEANNAIEKYKRAFRDLGLF